MILLPTNILLTASSSMTWLEIATQMNQKRQKKSERRGRDRYERQMMRSIYHCWGEYLLEALQRIPSSYLTSFDHVTACGVAVMHKDAQGNASHAVGTHRTQRAHGESAWHGVLRRRTHRTQHTPSPPSFNVRASPSSLLFYPSSSLHTTRILSSTWIKKVSITRLTVRRIGEREGWTICLVTHHPQPWCDVMLWEGDIRI